MNAVTTSNDLVSAEGDRGGREITSYDGGEQNVIDRRRRAYELDSRWHTAPDKGGDPPKLYWIFFFIQNNIVR